MALLASLAGGPVLALEKGSYSDGLYTAPNQLFSIRSPLGADTLHVDSFDRRTGAVTFIDEHGQLYGVVCTPNLDILAGADNDFETDAAILRNWLREATFPLFFQRATPDSAIVREEPFEFEGRPAWVAVIRVPRGSSMIRNDPETGEPTRLDSWRGIVVFSRGAQTYMLMKEASVDSAGTIHAFDAAAPDWNAFVASLAEFYRGMNFSPAASEVPQAPVDPPPDDTHAGT